MLKRLLIVACILVCFLVIPNSCNNETGTEAANVNDAIGALLAEATKMARRIAYCKRRGGLPYKQKCFYIPYLRFDERIYLDDANWKCLTTGGDRAEIQDREEERVLLDFLRTKIPNSRTDIDVWMGMKYIYMGKKVQYRSGKVIDIDELMWYRGNPVGFREEMVLRVDNRYEGLWSGYKYRLPGVMCESILKNH